MNLSLAVWHIANPARARTANLFPPRDGGQLRGLARGQVRLFLPQRNAEKAERLGCPLVAAKNRAGLQDYLAGQFRPHNGDHAFAVNLPGNVRQSAAKYLALAYPHVVDAVLFYDCGCERGCHAAIVAQAALCGAQGVWGVDMALNYPAPGNGRCAALRACRRRPTRCRTVSPLRTVRPRRCACTWLAYRAIASAHSP